MAEVVIVFRGLRDLKLGHLEERNVRTLAQDLLAQPSPAGWRVADNLDEALSADDPGGSIVVFLDDEDELDAVSRACSESLVLRHLPSVQRLSAEMARARAEL
jgi:hypothetical protein